MSKCFVCKKTMPDKDLTDIIESMQDYRERFADGWDEEKPVLICANCDEEIEEDEFN